MKHQHVHMGEIRQGPTNAERMLEAVRQGGQDGAIWPATDPLQAPQDASQQAMLAVGGCADSPLYATITQSAAASAAESTASKLIKGAFAQWSMTEFASWLYGPARM